MTLRANLLSADTPTLLISILISYIAIIPVELRYSGGIVVIPPFLSGPFKILQRLPLTLAIQALYLDLDSLAIASL